MAYTRFDTLLLPLYVLLIIDTGHLVNRMVMYYKLNKRQYTSDCFYFVMDSPHLVINFIEYIHETFVHVLCVNC